MSQTYHSRIAITKKSSPIILIITLSLLSAFGPFMTDMYLPSLPFLTQYFNTTTSLVQLSLSLSMLGLAIGQLLVGPLSDKFGRKRPLIISMWIFVFSTCLCIFSWDIYSFLAFRLIQGLAASGGIVLSKSIPTDKFTGKQLAKYLAIISAINGIAPVISPVLGGILMEFTNWRGIFVVLLALGIIILALSYNVKESLGINRRSEKSTFSTFISLGKVYRNPTYVFNSFTMVSAGIVLFSYISSSPYIIQEHYGFSPMIFGICFAVNALAITLGSALSMSFKETKNCIIVGSLGLVIFSIATAFCLIYDLDFIYFEIFLLLMLVFVGLIFPSSTTLALDSERMNAGSASAAIGATTFLAGSIAAPMVSIGNIMQSTAICMLSGALLTGVFTFLARRNEVKNQL